MPKRSLLRLAGAIASAMNAGYFTPLSYAGLRFAEQLAHLREQMHEIERLGQVAVGERAELDRARRLILIGIDRAHQHHRRRSAAALDLAHELEAVLARQLHVDETQIGRRAIELFDAFWTRCRRDGLVAVRRQEIHQDHLVHRVILDNEDLLHPSRLALFKTVRWHRTTRP